MADLASGTTLVVTGVGAAATAGIAATAQVGRVAVSDTMANVVANLSALTTLAQAGKLASISFTDATEPTLTLSTAIWSANAAALALVTSPYIDANATAALISVKLPTSPALVADINGDGRPDLLLGNYYYGGLASGGFSSATTIDPGLSSTSVSTMLAYADVTGDGKPDLVFGNSGTIGVEVGLGSGGLTAPVYYTTQFVGISQVLVADLNGDGVPDLIVRNGGTVDVLLGNGAGGFGAYSAVITSSTINQMAVVDINGDGKPDLVVDTGTAVLVYDGNGSGGFAAPVTLLSGLTIYSMAVGDLNGDGKPDIVVGLQAYSGGPLVEELLNAGNNNFQAPVTLLAGSLSGYSYAYGVSIGDLNGDGLPDIALNGNGGVAYALLNNGSGGFTTLSVPDGYTSVFLASLTGSNAADIISGPAAFYDGNSFTSAAMALAQAAGTTLPFSITDSSVNILAILDALQPFAAADRLVAINFTDPGTPVLALSATQYANDAGVLRTIQGSWTASLSGVTTAGAAAAVADSHVTSLTVSDTATNISSALDAGTTLANSKITSLTISDGGTLSIIGTNENSDAAALSHLSGASDVTLTGITGWVGYSFAQSATLKLTSPFAATDAVSVQLLSDRAFANTLSTLAINNGTITYTPGLITIANQGADTVVWQATDATTGAAITVTMSVGLSLPPGPNFTAVAGAPTLRSGSSATLGSVSPGFGTDAARVTLLQDPGFLAGGSTLTLNAAGNVVYTAGTVSTANVGPDTITFILTDLVTGATAVTQTSVDLLTSPAKSGDYTSDGRADLVVQNGTVGPAVWLMNGMSVTGNLALPNPGSTWHMVGAGDMNADGTSDMLWRADNGTVAVWLMGNTQSGGAGSLLGAAVLGDPGASWMPVAMADTNNDGMSDVILQNTSGQVAVWDMQGAAVTAGIYVANPGTSWHVDGAMTMGTGADLLLQNDDGTVALWSVNGGSISGAAVLANPGTFWHAVGLADLTGAGQPDVVLQGADGTVAVWDTNGSAITGGAIVASPGANWHVVGLSDLNGDGKTDITLQSDTGDVAAWLMNGASIAGGGLVSSPGINTQVMGLGPVQFINANAAGTIAANGIADDFVLSTPQLGGHTITGFSTAWDSIELSGTSFGSYAAVQAAMSSSGGGVAIALGGGATLSLSGVSMAQLAAKNFVLT